MIETALCRGSRFILAAILWAWILGVPPITVGQQSAKKSPSVKSEVAEVFHYTVKEGSGEITIAAPRYQVTVTREGLGLKVHRGGDLIFEVSPNSPLAEGFLPVQRPRSPWFRNLKGTVACEYAAGALRTELQPFRDRVRVTSWFYFMYPPSPQVLRWRLAPSGLWYGGAMQGLIKVHTLPLNSAHLEHDSFLRVGSTQGTPVWWATKGVGIWVRTPKDFRYAVNRQVNGRDDGLISVEMSGVSSITYDVLIANDARELVQHIIRQIGYPHSAPPAEYMRLPIYSAWVELGGGLNQEKVLEYAKTIRKHNLPAGVIEIDMGWETKYGDLKFDAAKFPNPKAMVDALHRMGFKVTLWVSNFVNVESEMFAAHRNDGMFCRDLTGNVGLIGWWAGEAAVWDYGNRRAAVFYRGLLNGLQEAYGVDGFKFDGGESNLAPQGLRGAGGITQFNYSDYFNREAVAHYPWNESRVGIYAQPVGTVQRLQDKRTLWGNQNGLDSLITQVFNCSLRGFFYVLPDIVGGSAGSESAGSESVDKELLIRWGQASALMPLIQFSRGPWHYDEETIRLVRELSNLHAKFSPYIYQLAVAAGGNGEPIIAPLWYQAPADRDAFGITDEFMVGKDVVVAPVLTQGARKRRLYLPEGNWSDYKTGSTLKGAAWLDDYPAPLDTLPIFIRCGSDPAASGKKACGP